MKGLEWKKTPVEFRRTITIEGLIGLMMGGELMPIRSAKELRENNQVSSSLILSEYYLNYSYFSQSV